MTQHDSDVDYDVEPILISDDDEDNRGNEEQKEKDGST